MGVTPSQSGFSTSLLSIKVTLLTSFSALETVGLLAEKTSGSIASKSKTLLLEIEHYLKKKKKKVLFNFALARVHNDECFSSSPSCSPASQLRTVQPLKA